MVSRRKWSLTTWLFVLNRYLLLTVAILTIVPSTAKVRQFVVSQLTTSSRLLVLTPAEVSARTHSLCVKVSLIGPHSCNAILKTMEVLESLQYVVMAREFILHPVAKFD